MKALKIILLVIFILILVLGTALFIFLKTFDINRYRSYIERQMTSALGRAVQIQGLQLGLTADKGVTLDVRGIAIADDPAFSPHSFLAADRIYLDIDVWAFVREKKIRISQVEIRNPRLHLIRAAGGKINLPVIASRTALPELFLAFGKRPARAALFEGKERDRTSGFSLASLEIPVVAPGVAHAAEAKDGRDSPVSWDLLIHAIRIGGGTFIFTDRSCDPPLDISLEDIDLSLRDLSLNKPFPFQFACSLWADQPNIRGHGHILFDKENKEITLQEAKAETDLSRLQIRKTPFYPLLRENLRLEGTPAGQLEVTVPRLKAGPAGLLELSAGGELTDGRIKLEMLEKAFEDMRISFRMTESDLDIQAMSAVYAEGHLTGEARVSDYLREKNFSYALHGEDIPLADVIPSRLMPALDEAAGPLKIEGMLSADFRGEGRLEGEDAASLIASLRGEGALKVKEGRLRNINLLKFILDKISFIPYLADRIESGLPETFKDKLRRGETSLDRVELAVNMRDGTLFFPEAAFSADGLLVTASGQLDFDQNMSLKADFYIPQDLSSAMVTAVEELAYLLNEENQIHIPLTPYEGALRELRIYPDVEGLGRKVIGGRGREELKKVIFRALDIEEEPPGPAREGEPPPEKAGEGNQDQPPPEAEPSPEGAVINSILDAIFKGDNPF